MTKSLQQNNDVAFMRCKLCLFDCCLEDVSSVFDATYDVTSSRLKPRSGSTTARGTLVPQLLSLFCLAFGEIAEPTAALDEGGIPRAANQSVRVWAMGATLGS